MGKLIEIHMIQNYSPSNLNRDDQGAPKTCWFGGVKRARVSSQCTKRRIRNPGNPEDIHNREPGYFAQEMKAYMGTRTKLFPWLVQRELGSFNIPQEDHGRIVMAAQRIAMSKEQSDDKKRAKADKRPMTPQLIHLNGDDARRFVNKLTELKKSKADHYAYFLNPIIGFQEQVRQALTDSGLSDKEQEKIVKLSWIIAKCRMKGLLREDEEEPDLEDGQPGQAHADFIAARLPDLAGTDDYKKILGKRTEQERLRLNEDAPEKPGHMDDFYAEIKKVMQGRSVDIALFGRMTTSDAFPNVAAAVQVAHAISTHALENQADYFTAVDDLAEGTGAGHVGEAQFASPCFYNYLCVDWDQLLLNLDGDENLAAATLGHFLIAAARTTPSGKQNSHAAFNEVAGILVEVKDTKTPTSYANAFAEPARRIGTPPDDAADEVSLIGRSIAQFGDHVYNVRKAYRTVSALFWYTPTLWRYPLRGWVREEDGRKKQQAMPLVTKENCFETLDPLVEAVIRAVGADWSNVRDAGKIPPKET